jgi:3-oxoadipate CoA-transferase beta subunit
MAARAARDIPEGWHVNLGIGVPLMIGDHIPPGREVILHSENGILGVGPAPVPGAADPWIVNAGKQHVTLVTGGSYFDHTLSFAIVRGRHLDLCVLGAFEVAENGDLANWTRLEEDEAPAVGGAMDLAIGAKRVWVVMEHVTKSGVPRLRRRCSYPLTAPGVVSRIYTDLAVLDVVAKGLRVVELTAGLTFAELQDRTEARLLCD